jgi:hypothetical protein
MTKQIELIPSFLDVRTLCGINPESLDYAERAYRTWCEAAGELQSQATEFLNSRLAKDSAAIVRFGQCRTPVEVLNTQLDYASNAFADLVDEGQKVVAYFGNMATEEMLPKPLGQLRSTPKSKAAGKNKRSPHRVAGH